MLVTRRNDRFTAATPCPERDPSATELERVRGSANVTGFVSHGKLE